MADFDRTENGSDIKKLATIFISKTELREQNKTLIGFGMERPYEKNGKEIEIGAVNVFYAIENARNFLNGVECKNHPVKIECGLQNEKHTYYTASTWIHNAVNAKTGQPYSLHKMAITIRPEIKNEAGEITQQQERIFATKNRNGVKGYSFDATNDQALEKEFIKNIAKGFNIGLVAEKNETLSKNPKLMEIINKIPDRSAATMNYDFVKQQGIVIIQDTMKLIDKSINKGAEMLNKEFGSDEKTNKKAKKEIER